MRQLAAGPSLVVATLFGVVVLTLSAPGQAQNPPTQSLPPLQQQQGSNLGLRPPSVALPSPGVSGLNPPGVNSAGQNPQVGNPQAVAPPGTSLLGRSAPGFQSPGVQSPNVQGASFPGSTVPGPSVPGPGTAASAVQGAAPNVQRPTAYGPNVLGQGSAQVAVPAVAVPRTNVWMPAGTARLQALDKVNAQATELTIKVGQSANIGSLTVTVKGCMVRPSGQPADATAFLDIKDSHPDAPGFAGWMMQDAPSISMMQHPIYDLRVTGCT